MVSMSKIESKYWLGTLKTEQMIEMRKIIALENIKEELIRHNSNLAHIKELLKYTD